MLGKRNDPGHVGGGRKKKNTDTQTLQYPKGFVMGEMKAAPAATREPIGEAGPVGPEAPGPVGPQAPGPVGPQAPGPDPRTAELEYDRARTDLQMEIAALRQDLARYGFRFADMKEAAPQSEKTRDLCRDVICYLLLEGRMPQIRRDGHLPMGEVCTALNISHKKIEPHQRYILAACEILDGDFPYLREFLGETRAQLRGEQGE